jgi:hypothetical protein
MKLEARLLKHSLVTIRACQQIVKMTILFFALAAFVSATEGSELNHESVFDSVDAFVATVKAFQPAASRGDLSSLFTISDRDLDEHCTSVTALAIESCATIWADDKSALLFATANPPTIATHSSIGVLFLLVRQRDHWQIADLLRFTATGKEAEVSAEQTAFAGSGRQLGCEGFAPVITVKESQGGRGYAYRTCASYTFARSKLKRLELQ